MSQEDRGGTSSQVEKSILKYIEQLQKYEESKDYATNFRDNIIKGIYEAGLYVKSDNMYLSIMEPVKVKMAHKYKDTIKSVFGERIIRNIEMPKYKGYRASDLTIYKYVKIATFFTSYFCGLIDEEDIAERDLPKIKNAAGLIQHRELYPWEKKE